MIIIRPTQLAAFQDLRHERFLDAMAAHARREFPSAVAALDEVALRRQVGTVAEQASAYGIDTERDHARFLNLAIALGWSFFTQPGFSWVGEYLQDRQVSDMGARVDRVVSRCIRQLKVGEENAAARRAFTASSS